MTKDTEMAKDSQRKKITCPLPIVKFQQFLLDSHFFPFVAQGRCLSHRLCNRMKISSQFD